MASTTATTKATTMTTMTSKAMTTTARTKGSENDVDNDEELANVKKRMRQLLWR